VIAAFQKNITIYFDGKPAVIPIAQLARDCAVTVADVEGTIEALLRKGLLTRRQDGTFDAALPEATHV